MADVDRIRELTTRALNEFEAGKPVSALVRQATELPSFGTTTQPRYGSCSSSEI
jgi:hypothetical protein